MVMIRKGTLTKLKDMGFASNVKMGVWTFTYAKAEEGIIVPAKGQEQILNFAYIDGERIEGEASSEVIATATELLYADLYPKTERQKKNKKLGPHAEIATPNDQEVRECVDDIDTALSVMQDNITIDAVSTHPGAIQVLLTLQKTPETYIKHLTVAKAKNGKPAAIVPYVDGQYMTRALNFAFLFDWSFEVPETRQDGDFFTALGLLTVNLDGKTITKSQWGSQKMRAGMELGDALKGATTDALKKCASMFGIAADVYAGEV